MKNTPASTLFSFRKFSLPALLLAASLTSLKAETRYFDKNDSDPGFGLTSGSTYTWNTTDAVWNLSSAGTGTDFSAWTNGDIAVFTGTGFGNGSVATIELAGPMTLGGLTQTVNGTWTFQAASATTLTFSPGAVVSGNGGTALTGIVLGSNINVSGDFTVATPGYATLRIEGTGAAYQGTITVEASVRETAGFLLDANSRARAEYVDADDKHGSTKFIINSGALVLGANATSTIKGLSGAGGITYGTGGKLIIDQSDNTEWAGSFFGAGNASTTVTKAGTGRLSLTNASAVHRFGTGALNIDDGSLYVAGAISRGGSTLAFYLNVADGATFGGTAKVDKRVQLAAAGSVLNPGMYGKAGTLELQYGILAGDGGIFDFDMNGDDGEGGLLNGRILFTTAGTVTLDGNKIVKFSDLGAGLIESGVAYTLIDASDEALTLDTGWNQNWSYDLGSTGWQVESFGWTGNRLEVTFSAIPEPSTFLAFGGGLAALLIFRRRTSSSLA